MKKLSRYFLTILLVFTLIFVCQRIPKYPAEKMIIVQVLDDYIHSIMFRSVPTDSLKKHQGQPNSKYHHTLFLEQYVHWWRFGKVQPDIVKSLHDKYIQRHILIRNKNDFKKVKIKKNGTSYVFVKDKETGEIGEIFCIQSIRWKDHETVTVRYKTFAGLSSDAEYKVNLIFRQGRWYVSNRE